MIITRIPYTKISLEDLITLSNRVYTVLEERHPDEDFFRGVLGKVTAGVAMGTQAMGSTRASSLTDSIEAADRDRDDSFDSLRYHVRAGLKRNNALYQHACERLYAIFQRNGLNLSRLPYNQQSGALASLFADLNESQATRDLEVVHATAWLQELKDDQIAFEEALRSRVEERSENEVPTDAEAREALIPALKGLFKTLDVAEENELVAEISETLTRCNVIIREVTSASRS